MAAAATSDIKFIFTIETPPFMWFGEPRRDNMYQVITDRMGDKKQFIPRPADDIEALLAIIRPSIFAQIHQTQIAENQLGDFKGNAVMLGDIADVLMPVPTKFEVFEKIRVRHNYCIAVFLSTKNPSL